MFEIDWVIIILHDGTFSDIGQKPPFSVILWSLEGQNLTNMAPKKINSDQSPNKCSSVHTKFELDCKNAFSDNGKKTPFPVISWPIEGQNMAKVVKKQINSEHSPSKCTHQVWIGLHEYFFR